MVLQVSGVHVIEGPHDVRIPIERVAGNEEAQGLLLSLQSLLLRPPWNVRKSRILDLDGRVSGYMSWDQLRETRYAKQLKSGLIPKKFALSKRPAHIPAWDSLSEKDRAWEASRMEVFAAMVGVMDQNIGRIIAKLKAKGSAKGKK